MGLVFIYDSYLNGVWIEYYKHAITSLTFE